MKESEFSFIAYTVGDIPIYRSVVGYLVGCDSNGVITKVETSNPEWTTASLMEIAVYLENSPIVGERLSYTELIAATEWRT